MGCICSKAIARSMSIKDELSNHGFQSSAVAWEELLSSHSGTDHLFALVCSATHKSSDFTHTTPQVDKCTSNPSNHGPDSRQDYGTSTRSKREAENKMGWRDMSLAGSRSFHTVEEYDGLIERIRKFSTRSVQHFGDCDLNVGNENGNRTSLEVFDDVEKVVRTESMRETGWKRRAVAKGLKPLDVSTIEFSGIGRSGQVVDVAGGEIYSADSYTTPKFGSYNGRVQSRVEEGGREEGSGFSREMLAAFEDCMHQLQVEEESIFRKMDKDVSSDEE